MLATLRLGCHHASLASICLGSGQCTLASPPSSSPHSVLALSLSLRHSPTFVTPSSTLVSAG